jgi:SSS family solute:Na+ symporter
VYRKLRPQATETELVTFGRGSTIILVGLGFAWIPMMKYVSPQLYIYLQSVQAYIAPPIAACFLFGVLSTRVNGTGAMAALLTGLVLGAARLGLELGKASLTPGSAPYWFANINFLHFAALLFVLSTLILAGVSYATPAPSPERTADLTYKTAAVSSVAQDDPSKRRVNVIASVVLVVVICILWIIFR